VSVSYPCLGLVERNPCHTIPGLQNLFNNIAASTFHSTYTPFLWFPRLKFLCIFYAPIRVTCHIISLFLIYLFTQYLYNYYLLCINELIAFNKIFTGM